MCIRDRSQTFLAGLAIRIGRVCVPKSNNLPTDSSDVVDSTVVRGERVDRESRHSNNIVTDELLGLPFSSFAVLRIISMMIRCVSLNDTRSTAAPCATLVGGKAVSLAKQCSTPDLSHHVPNAFAHTVDFFRPWIDVIVASHEYDVAISAALK